LPYKELDMTFPYHRWMYHYYPSFYSSYGAYNWPLNYPADDSNVLNGEFYYGGNYGGDYGGDFAGYYGDYSMKKDPLYRAFPYRTESPNRVIIPPLFQSPKFNSNDYPTSETGFAGGLYSQRFSNAGSSLRRGSIQGRAKEGFNTVTDKTITNHCNDFGKNSYRKIDTDTNLLVNNIASRGGNTAFPYKILSCNQKNQIEQFENVNSSCNPATSNDQTTEYVIDTTPEIIDYSTVRNMPITKKYQSYPGYSLFAKTQLDYPDDKFGYVINDDTKSTIDNKSASSSNETDLMNKTIAESGLEEPIGEIL